MANIFPYHLDEDDEDRHSVASSRANLSAVSSVISVQSSIDYDIHNPYDEELGPHGDDQWTVTNIQVVIDVDGVLDSHLQHPSDHPPVVLHRVAPPHRISSDSVLVTDIKRKRSSNRATGSAQPNKRTRVSVSDTVVSSHIANQETPHHSWKKSIRPARCNKYAHCIMKCRSWKPSLATCS